MMDLVRSLDCSFTLLSGPASLNGIYAVVSAAHFLIIVEHGVDQEFKIDRVTPCTIDFVEDLFRSVCDN
jgi:hypothetical protein